MNTGKKAISIMLFVLIIVAFISFVYNKYLIAEKINDETKKNIIADQSKIIINKKEYTYTTTNGKFKIDVQDEQSIRDIMRNFKYCSMSAGIPLDLEQQETGLMKIVGKSPFSVHDEVNSKIEIGDSILGTGYVANGSEIGHVKTIQILKKDSSYVQDISYKVVPILYCFN